jgi:hypothetical protein
VKSPTAILGTFMNPKKILNRILFNVTSLKFWFLVTTCLFLIQGLITGPVWLAACGLVLAAREHAKKNMFISRALSTTIDKDL